jgi:preprotein translocase subunit SecF
MRLMMILFSMIGTTLAGIGVVAVLTMGTNSWQTILGAALVGAIVALPASWYVARQIENT